MKTINETFTEEEFKKLLKAKKASKVKTWREFILLLVDDGTQQD